MGEICFVPKKKISYIYIYIVNGYDTDILAYMDYTVATLCKSVIQDGGHASAFPRTQISTIRSLP